MATSPAPDAAAPPGMCPGIVVLGGGGGGGGGGGDGDGSGGKDGSGGSGSGRGDGASGDGKNGGKGCGDPVCPVTGRVFVEIFDFGFSAPMQLRWVRQYSSQSAHIDGEVGLGWTHSYGWRLRQRRRSVEVLDEGNRLQEFALSRNAEVATNPLGYKLARRGTGFVLSDREGIVRTFGAACPDGFHHLLSVADRNGNTIELQRDERGRLLGLRDSAGRLYRVTTNEGKIKCVDVALNAEGSTWMEVVRYAYDAEGHLSSATDAEGFVGRYSYDRHLLVRHHSPSGPTYVYRYDGHDSRARCIESWGEDDDGKMPLGVLHEPSAVGTAKGIYYQRFTYDPATRYTEVEDGLGGFHRFFGDEEGRVTKEVTPSGGVCTYHFDRQDGTIAARSHEDESVTVVKSGGGRPNGFETSNGENISTTRDEEGFEVSIYSSERGDPAVVRRSFDERGNLRVLVHHDGSRESFDVDQRGLVTRWFDRRGALTQYFHDAMGNCVAIVGPGGNTERMEYDYLGRRVRHVDASGRETTWIWDRRNEPVEKRTPDGYVARVRYDGIRNPLFVDEAGKVTQFEWGGQGWLTRLIEPSGATTAYQYDVHGNLRRVTNAVGQTFSSEVDHAGRWTGWTTFEGVTYGAGYDAADRVTHIRKPTGRTLLEYDDASRLASLECPDGTQVAFAYEGRGGPSRVGGSLVPVERFLDAIGRVHGEQLGDHQLRVAWSAGSAIRLDSDVGLPVRYNFDVAGRLDQVLIGDKARVLDRESGDDFLTSLGARLVLRRRFGLHGRLSYQGLGSRTIGTSEAEIALPGAPGTILFVEYEYDVRGNLTRERRSDGRSIEYELTADGQVASRRVYRGGKLERDEKIAYDLTGTPRMAGARYDAVGRPTEIGGEALDYDALGRLIRRTTDAGQWHYEWNGLDQLVRVRAPSHVVEMDYDARGRRIRKRVLRQGEVISKTSYVWNNNLVVHEVDEISGATRTYDRIDGAWETFGHVDKRDGEARATYYLLSPGGAVDRAVNEDGATVWDAESTIYGHREVVRADVNVTARFPNQFYDADVGLAYTWHRWYDARLGVFVTPDPLFLEGNLNPREFARNPLSGCDPTGWHTVPVPAGMTPAQYMAQPGRYATPGTAAIPGSVACPPSMHSRGVRCPATEQGIIDRAGKKYGCHSCNASSPGTKSGHWVADHQAPLSTFGPGGPPAGASMRLYPHCLNCSRVQGGLMSHHATTVGPGAANAAHAALMPP